MKITIALFSLMFMVAATNCGSPQATKLEQGLVSCATVDIGTTIPEIGMTVYQDVKTILEAGLVGWEAALIGIAVKYGVDAVECAVKAAYDAFSAHPAGTMAPSPSPAAIRAKTFMATQHYKYAQ